MPQGVSRLLTAVWLAGYVVAHVAAPWFHNTEAHRRGGCCDAARHSCTPHGNSGHANSGHHEHSAHDPAGADQGTRPGDGGGQHDSCAACRFLAQASNTVVFVSEDTAAELVSQLFPIQSYGPRDISLALHHSRAPPSGC